MKTLPIALLGLLVALGLALRLAQASPQKLGEDEGRWIRSRWLLDDPDTCYHLRAAELALRLPRAAERDPYLNHPGGAESPWLPMYDTLLSGFAGRFLSERGVDPAEGGVDEARLERIGVRISPFLGLATILLAWAAARSVCGGPRRELAALVAAGIVALAPAAIGAGAAGKLDATAWSALVLAFAAWTTALALRAETLLDGLLSALFAGAAMGLVCASFLGGGLLFLGGAVGFALRAWSADAEARRNVLRAGLVYAFVAAFAGQLPPGAAPELGLGATQLATAWESALRIPLFAGIPFLAAFALSSSRGGRFFQAAAMAACIVVILYGLPGALEALVARGRGWSEHRELVTALDAGARPWFGGGARELLGAAFALSPLALLAPWAARAAWTSRRDPVAAFLVVTTLAALGLALVERRFVGLAVVPVALLVARAIDARWGELAPARARVAFGGAALALLAGVPLARPAPIEGDGRVARVELLRALRWIRTETAAPAAWNDPDARPSWGVLATPRRGAVVLFHARRPAVATVQGAASSTDGLRETARALLAPEPAHLVRYLRGAGARYVVVSPLDALDAPVLEALAERTWTGSVLERLASARGADDPCAKDGLVLAWRSDANVRFELPGGGAAEGAAVSVYRLADDAPAPELPQMRAR